MVAFGMLVSRMPDIHSCSPAILVRYSFKLLASPPRRSIWVGPAQLRYFLHLLQLSSLNSQGLPVFDAYAALGMSYVDTSPSLLIQRN